MKFKIFFIFLLFPIFFIISCGDDNKTETTGCEDVSCEDWERCQEGSCILKYSRCNDHTDCEDNKICNNDHYCIETSDPCVGQTCSGNGTCVVENNQAICNCNDGYVADGLTCINITNPCEGQTCSSHGDCIVENNQPKCNCDEGYLANGLSCIEENVDLCENVQCDSWKTCNPLNGLCELNDGKCDFTTDCSNDQICQNNICINEVDFCEGVNCSGHGTCSVDQNNQPLCNCDIGYIADGLSCIENSINPITSVEWNGKLAQVNAIGEELKTYTITTNIDLMDNIPENKQRVITERSGDMLIRTNNTLFDALFALSLKEVLENSVSNINDWGFNNGNDVPCECFETGLKWKYVWTRDTSYAVNLSLAFVDPTRSKNSLSFKISDRKQAAGGSGKQIIQDTGTGGSWPISSDRVTWALGAYETLKYLDGDERESFLNNAYEAIKNTVEIDRSVIYDEIDGLYKGEQSFLDWREQTYPYWTADDTVHIGMSKVLSTNVLHYIILDVASKLALEKGDTTNSTKYANWRDQLAISIKDGFYLESEQLFSAMKTTYLNYAPIKKYDLLGQSLAILSGVATPEQAENVVANYPITEAGPSVIWPQEPSTRVYHNRGIWPFVTAYALRASYKVENDKAYNNALISLYRGTAFNLSNMENFEFSTLSNNYYDGRKDYSNRDLTGPVVNSQRQLWSVAGYISMVVDSIFGLQATQTGVYFSPKISKYIRNELFNTTSVLNLKNFKYKGKLINITIYLPEISDDNDGFYVTDEVRLNGNLKNDEITSSDLLSNNEITITLKNGLNSGEVTLKNCISDESNCFAPHAPSINSVVAENGNLKLNFSAGENDNNYGISSVTFNIYRDGELIASNISGGEWSDTNSSDFANRSYCYSVTSVSSKGIESHIANPICYWGDSYERIEEVDIENDFNISPNAWDHGRAHFADWGTPDEELILNSFTPESTGTYIMQIEYGNGRPIDTGITACFKIVEIWDNSNNQLVKTSVVMMPHLGRDNWDRWGNSSFVEAELNSSKSYKIVIKDLFNMSYFQHFVIYTAGTGGGEEIYNRANIGGIKFLLKSR